MLSTDLVLQLCACAGALGLLPSPVYGQQGRTVAVVCPESLTLTETAAPVPGWTATTAKVQHAFERISVFNGSPGGAEFELAPEGQKREGTGVTQTWELKAYRTMNIFLRCRYHDTTVVLLREVPPAVETCTLRFTADGRGKVIGKSAMDCR